MTKPDSNTGSEQFSEHSELTVPQPAPDKKPFVEPVVSVPVDVLEATTFFQASTVESTTV